MKKAVKDLTNDELKSGLKYYSMLSIFVLLVGSISPFMAFAGFGDFANALSIFGLSVSICILFALSSFEYIVELRIREAIGVKN